MSELKLRPPAGPSKGKMPGSPREECGESPQTGAKPGATKAKRDSSTAQAEAGQKEKQIPHPHSRDNHCARLPRAKRGTEFGMTIGEKARAKAAHGLNRDSSTAQVEAGQKEKQIPHPHSRDKPLRPLAAGERRDWVRDDTEDGGRQSGVKPPHSNDAKMGAESVR
jgi:hypothetical protein